MYSADPSAQDAASDAVAEEEQINEVIKATSESGPSRYTQEAPPTPAQVRDQNLAKTRPLTEKKN